MIHVLRLIGKRIIVGVIENGRLLVSETGTGQGQIISPLLANLYLHDVLDVWFEEEVKPRLKGQAFEIRPRRQIGAKVHNRCIECRSRAMLSANKEKVSARIPRESRKLLEKAAALSGATLNQFVVQAAIKEAQTLLAREQTIMLTEADADRFFAALERPPAQGREGISPFRLDCQGLSFGSHHDRASFDCGQPDFENYLKRIARQHADEGVSRTYALVNYVQD